MDRQEKLAQKGRAAAELAHELRNPLTAINLRLQMLSEALDVDSNEDRDVRLVRKEIRRLNLILEDFSRLDRVPQPVMASVSSSVLLRDIDGLMQPVAADNGIRFKVEEARESMVRVDPAQIKQVLLNVTKNAFESVDHDGEVVLRSFSSTATVSNKVRPVWVVEVEDNGPGITPEAQTKLFEPFFTTKQNGTGLGLAIAERIVQQHKGAIDFESTPGKGTRFRIVLPLKEQV
jgi:signal transduction histidine kinase